MNSMEAIMIIDYRPARGSNRTLNVRYRHGHPGGTLSAMATLGNQRQRWQANLVHVFVSHLYAWELKNCRYIHVYIRLFIYKTLCTE